MGCFQSSNTDEGIGWCGMSGSKETLADTPNEETTDEGKPGQKPSEVLRLSRDVTTGLMRTYQKVRLGIKGSQRIRLL
jgi:hypothetical protein